MPRFELGLDEIAATVADLLKKERKAMLAHLERRVALAESKAAGPRGNIREENLHRRLTALESQVRGLERELTVMRKAIR